MRREEAIRRVALPQGCSFSPLLHTIIDLMCAHKREISRLASVLRGTNLALDIQRER